MNIVIFIFRRDFRTYDNIGWNEMVDFVIKESSSNKELKVLPIFIFNPQQVDQNKNKYASINSLQFMAESLLELQNEVPIKFLYGNDIEILDSLKKKINISAIFFNKDYTPFSKDRDAAIEKWCSQHNIICKASYEEYSLINPDTMVKPYRKFTPYYKKYLNSCKFVITEKEQSVKYLSNDSNIPSKFVWSPSKIKNKFINKNDKVYIHGGRKNALKILSNIQQGNYKAYMKTKEYPHNENGTTKLSAFLKFGCVSVREVFNVVTQTYGKNHALIRELFWRSFYDQLVYHYPQVLNGQKSIKQINESLNSKYDKIEWTKPDSLFLKWKQGLTGFPIVDAGMRQLVATGYMHNRVRMIVASFLIKDLHIDWRQGEQYFASQLIDYHPSANNGGWQWASGGGADAQQYNRIFNPWIQSQKFDPTCEYIKKWVKELESVDPKDIHKWFDSCKKIKSSYPCPIIDHKEESMKTKKIYSKYLYK